MGQLRHTKARILEVIDESPKTLTTVTDELVGGKIFNILPALWYSDKRVGKALGELVGRNLIAMEHAEADVQNNPTGPYYMLPTEVPA
jgi:hypothetical protein